MRDFTKISPAFWISSVTKKVREGSPEGLIVSLYLMSSPHSNMLGLYYLPKVLIAHETGLGFEGASKGLQRCIEAGFCHYDVETEMVWIPEMAGIQIGRGLLEKDNRCKGIASQYQKLPDNPFLSIFYDEYKNEFHLPNKRVSNNKNGSPFEAPLKQGEGEGEGEGKHKNIKHMSGSEKKPNRTKPPDKKYPDEFEGLWLEYPRRSGSAGKAGALKAWQARRREGIPHETMLAAVRRYAAYCIARSLVGSEFVQMAQTFLGKNHEFDNPWIVNLGNDTGGIKNGIPDGRSLAERQLNAGREEWLREQQEQYECSGYASMAPVGLDDQNLLEPLDYEEWQPAEPAVGKPDGGDDT